MFAICKAAFYYLRNISRVRKYLSSQTAEMLVYSLASSKLDYCNSILYGLPNRLVADGFFFSQGRHQDDCLVVARSKAVNSGRVGKVFFLLVRAAQHVSSHSLFLPHNPCGIREKNRRPPVYVPKESLKKLQHVQNAVVKVVTHTRKCDHITPVLC